jgi:hypothetical protein
MSAMYKRWPRTLPLMLALFGMGCGGIDDALQDAVTGRDSARATAYLTAEAWSRGDVSPRFASLVFAAARARVEKDRRRLATRESDAAEERVRPVIGELEDLSARLARLARAAEQGDLAGAQSLVGDLPPAPSP